MRILRRHWNVFKNKGDVISISNQTIWRKMIVLYGSDILESANMQLEKQYLQHGSVSVYQHSLGVAYLCLALADKLHVRVDRRALVRGALLHDYFLYDWHVRDQSHRLHGFTHAGRALQNADRDFQLGSIERDMIRKHMFPLNVTPPKYRESVILCMADKICAVWETCSEHSLSVSLSEI